MAAVAERLRRANETIRKLQKDLVDDRGKAEVTEREPDAASILAATATAKLEAAVKEAPAEEGEKNRTEEKAEEKSEDKKDGDKEKA